MAEEKRQKRVAKPAKGVEPVEIQEAPLDYNDFFQVAEKVVEDWKKLIVQRGVEYNPTVRGYAITPEDYFYGETYEEKVNSAFQMMYLKFKRIEHAIKNDEGMDKIDTSDNLLDLMSYAMFALVMRKRADAGIFDAE